MKDKLEKLIDEKKYSKVKELISKMYEHDIADILEEFPLKEMIKLFRLLPKSQAADVFSYLDTDTQTNIISMLSDTEAVNIINDMAADDATDLIDEMPANVVKRLLNKVDKETRRDINQLLKYPDNSAGSIMTTEYIDLKEYNTVRDATKKIRQEYDETETIETMFITDKSRKLIGTIELKDLIVHNDDEMILDIMNNDVISVNTLMDQEEVANIIKDYDLTSVPVVDSENKLVGIVTIDDVVDIIEAEATEDIEKMNAILPTEKSYLKLSIIDIWKSRIPWLLLLMVSATFTGKIIQHYEESLATMVILTAFIPMIMDTGGNAGGQASATIIRSLSLNDVEFKDILKVIFKELRVSFLIGLTLAVANFLKLLYIDRVTTKVALVVCSTLVLTVCVAKVIGCSLPMIAKKLKFDPAVMASPFITTIVDAVSLFIYFRIAVTVLGI